MASLALAVIGLAVAVAFALVGCGTSDDRRAGRALRWDLDDPASFSGEFYEAKATGTFSGQEDGFSFESEPGADTDDSYATLGTEKNGTFL